MSPKLIRYKVLLDENFPTRKYFPWFNQRFDVKHLVVDLKKGGIKDPEVHDLAVQQHRLIVTYNVTEDLMKALATKSKKSGVIGVSTNVSFEHIDKKLTSLLTKKKPGELFGKFTYITEESI